jgi:hypothetical protein
MRAKDFQAQMDADEAPMNADETSKRFRGHRRSAKNCHEHPASPYLRSSAFHLRSSAFPP